MSTNTINAIHRAKNFFEQFLATNVKFNNDNPALSEVYNALLSENSPFDMINRIEANHIHLDYLTDNSNVNSMLKKGALLLYADPSDEGFIGIVTKAPAENTKARIVIFKSNEAKLLIDTPVNLLEYEGKKLYGILRFHEILKVKKINEVQPNGILLFYDPYFNPNGAATAPGVIYRLPYPANSNINQSLMILLTQTTGQRFRAALNSPNNPFKVTQNKQGALEYNYQGSTQTRIDNAVITELNDYTNNTIFGHFDNDSNNIIGQILQWYKGLWIWRITTNNNSNTEMAGLLIADGRLNNTAVGSSTNVNLLNSSIAAWGTVFRPVGYNRLGIYPFFPTMSPSFLRPPSRRDTNMATFLAGMGSFSISPNPIAPPPLPPNQLYTTFTQEAFLYNPATAPNGTVFNTFNNPNTQTYITTNLLPAIGSAAFNVNGGGVPHQLMGVFRSAINGNVNFTAAENFLNLPPQGLSIIISGNPIVLNDPLNIQDNLINITFFQNLFTPPASPTVPNPTPIPFSTLFTTTATILKRWMNMRDFSTPIAWWGEVNPTVFNEV